MSKFQQGTYTVMNQSKYAGKGAPKFRSGWELAFMRFCDSNDHIITWSSESLAIPYRNPMTGKPTRYIPDFLIQYRNKNNQVFESPFNNRKESRSAGRRSLREWLVGLNVTTSLIKYF